MNRLLLSILLFTFVQSGFTQKVRFTDTSNTWKVRASGKDYLGNPYSASYHYYYDGDTIVKGNSYKRMLSYSRQQSGYSTYPRPDIYFMREDTVNGKIWSRVAGYGIGFSDTSEKLIYNANWALNDTIINSSGQGQLYIISFIDSTQIQGNWHRVFGVRTPQTQQTKAYYSIIEGVGSDIGPGYAFTGGFSLESGYRLLCFFNQGSRPVLNPVFNSVSGGSFSNTASCNLAVSDLENDDAVRLYPNPVTSTSRIELKSAVEKGVLIIYDGLGRVVGKVEIVQSESVSLPAITQSGIYHYTLRELRSGLAIHGTFAIGN
jgi:hypothetical protein